MATPTHLINQPSDGYTTTIYVGPDETALGFKLDLAAFDGVELYGQSICRLPRPGWAGDFTEDEISAANDCYLQVGGTAQRMTVEIRKAAAGGGGYQQFAVGHPPTPSAAEPPAEAIQLGEHTTLVYPNEIFTADEAAELFFYYHKNDDIPESYLLRELNSEG